MDRPITDRGGKIGWTVVGLVVVGLVGYVLYSFVGAIAFGWYGVFFGPIVLVFFLHLARDVFPDLLGGEAGPRG